MKKSIPQKTLRGNKNNKQWTDRNVKTSIRKRNKLFQKQKSTKKPKDIKRYIEAKSNAHILQRKVYWEYVDNLIEIGNPDSDENPNKQKRFWSYVNALRKDNSGVIPLKDSEKMNADTKDKADILNRKYESVFTKEDITNIPNPAGISYPSMPNIKVKEEGVKQLLQKTNPNKACGSDLIASRILKELSSELTPFLTLIFKKTIDEGDVPSDGKYANVTALFKKGDRFKASNSRPVSLT